MVLQIKEKSKSEINSILLPFEQDHFDDSLFEQYSGISVKLNIPLEPKTVTCLYHPVTGQKVFVLGLGNEKDMPKSDNFYRSFIQQQKTKGDLIIDVICDHLSDNQLVYAIIGLRKSLYKIGKYKTNGDGNKKLIIHAILNKKRHRIAKAAIEIAEAQLSAMYLVDEPSNTKTPIFMGDFVKESAKKYGYDAKVLDAKELKKIGMHALLAVGQGSANPPVCIIMEYKPTKSKSKTPKLGLVGKGISFDTGGISIKPSTNMGYMKCDMAGAAAVIGAIELAARLQLNIHIVGIVPAAENSVDANSIRPGDVISSYSGKSIEVIDTDAEGRLVLADGLAYVIKNYEPEYIIDLATLTGSCVATLGYSAAGMFTHNDEMAQDLSSSGHGVHERVWRLPLWEEYGIEMQSDIADIKNLSGKPIAGAITAAKFLEYFVSEHRNWVHLDIAGVSFTDSEFAKTRTATAYGVRLLSNYMEKLIEK